MKRKAKMEEKREPKKKQIPAEWFLKNPFLIKHQDSSDFLQCTLCSVPSKQCVLRWQSSVLSQHLTSKAHTSKVQVQTSNKTIPFKKIEPAPVFDPRKDKIKKAEICLATNIAMHSSSRSTDHIVDIIQTNADKNSILENIQLHRTKQIAILKNVVAPELRSQLKEDLAGRKFTLMVDESTDLSVTKYMAVSIKYFSITAGNCIEVFLGIIPVIRTTAQVLWTALESFIKDTWELDFKNCTGLATDNANNVAGQHNSLWTYFREAAAPGAVHFPCTMHSLNIIVSRAWDSKLDGKCWGIPGAFLVFIRSIPTFFSSSVIRREEFKKFVALLEKEERSKRNPFSKFNQTRFLSRYPLLDSINVHFNNLQAFFKETAAGKTSYAQSLDGEKRYASSYLGIKLEKHVLC